MAIRLSYQTFPGMLEERQHLQALISQFRQAVHRHTLLKSDTPIQIVMLPGNDNAKNMAEHLQHKGLDVRAILYPTVPEGQERLRIVLHSFNTAAEVKMLLGLLSD
jgi:8-amino-7-oxononanoate synthase